MEVKDIVTLIIALYGAGLSTILMIREIQREKRQIKVILEYVDWLECAQIIIVNIGHRPITITDFGMEVFSLNVGKGDYESIPQANLITRDTHVGLPVTLKDGERVTIALPEDLGTQLAIGDMKAKIRVYDAEGNVYRRFETRRFDAKWGVYYKRGPIDALVMRVMSILRKD